MAEAEVKPRQIKKPKVKASVVSAKKPKKKQPKPKRVPAFGRPLKFKTIRELDEAIKRYFADLYEPLYDAWGKPLKDENGKQRMIKTEVATITGLAVALGTTRETLLDYELGKHDGKDLTAEQLIENEQIDDFSDTIKKAKLRIYADTEQQLYKGKPIGAIFSLKNNYGWRDKTEVETRDLTPPPPLSPRKDKR